MHFKDPKLIPEHIKNLIDPAQRKELGISTQYEKWQGIKRYNERKLHADIRQLLNLKGIEYFESRMDKRSHTTVGWPDFTFAVYLGKSSSWFNDLALPVQIPCAWECKVENRKPTPEQEEKMRKMQAYPNAWRVRVIRSLKEAADELKALGI
jgi:hypothetical protein